MDSLKEKIVITAKEFRLFSYNLSKHNQKFQELNDMNEKESKEGKDVLPLNYAQFMQEYEPAVKDFKASEKSLTELFGLIDELTVSEGGSLPE